MLVGCGAGGAIAAAFGAPLTGAFYASELIIGAYSLANAGPIFAAALAATLTTKALLGAPYVIVAPPVAAARPRRITSSWSALGLISAALGVGAMRAAALLERGFAATRAPRWARPVLGGLILAAMALYTPQVLGAGHGAIGLDFSAQLSAATLATLLALKLSASLISLARAFAAACSSPRCSPARCSASSTRSASPPRCRRSGSTRPPASWRAWGR